MKRFSAPINPERPRGAPSCAKCVRSFTLTGDRPRMVCGLGHDLTPCEQFRDASVDRTERGGLKVGYFTARAA